jgi:hypothetical protein
MSFLGDNIAQKTICDFEQKITVLTDADRVS